MLARLIGLTVAVTVIAGVTVAQAAQPQTNAANSAVQYIESLQNADGGFPAFGTESSPGSTIDAVFALIAVGVDPATVTNGGQSPVDYLSTQASTYAADVGGAAKLALGVSLLRLDQSSFGGINLLSIMASNLNEGTGVYGLDVFDEAFFILAQVSGGGKSDPTATAQYLRSLQQADGGWEFAEGFGSDSNTTAFALQALLAWGTGTNEPITEAGLEYLRQAQNADGGFGFLPGEDSDPNSTAVIIQTLLAANQDIDEGGPWAPEGRTPLEGLLAFQNEETGAFQYAGEDSPFATYQAVPALMLATFPSLETRPDGFPPVPTSPLIGDPAPPTSTPAATPVALPPTGDGFVEGARKPWFAVVALVLVGLAAGVSTLELRRR